MSTHEAKKNRRSGSSVVSSSNLFTTRRSSDLPPSSPAQQRQNYCCNKKTLASVSFFLIAIGSLFIYLSEHDLDEEHVGHTADRVAFGVGVGGVVLGAILFFKLLQRCCGGEQSPDGEYKAMQLSDIEGTLDETRILNPGHTPDHAGLVINSPPGSAEATGHATPK